VFKRKSVNLVVGRPSRRRPSRRALLADLTGIELLDRRVVPAVTAVLSAAQGVLTVTGDAQDNTITVSRDALGTILVNNGAITVQGGTPTTANTRLIQISGLGGNDNLSLDETNGALPGANIDGGDGNDVLSGGSGNDVLTGGAGNDTFRFDTDNALGSDFIDESGGGVDTLDFSATTTRAVSINLGNVDTVPFFATTTGAVSTDLGNPAAQVVNDGLTLTLSAGDAIENVIGGALGDTITGNALNNVIEGGGGDDVLDGGAGNDTYRFDTDNALGSDTIRELDAIADPGSGVDTLDFSATTTRAVSIDLGAIKGTQQVVNAGLTLSIGVDNIENVTGGALGDTITGNALNNVIDGGSGNDTIEGRGGNDTLTGGAGNDIFRFDTDNALGSDTINESGGGIDTLDFSATTTRAVSIDLGNAAAQVVNAGLTLTLSSGATIENVIGGALGDTITGNALNNTLTGGAGNDTYLFDTDNALGSDTIDESGGGFDRLDFSATTTRAVAVNLGIAGAQVVNAGLTLTLSSGATIETVIGGALGDTLTGNALNNVIEGGGGNDVLTGGAGNDTYRFDTDNALGSDTIDESGGGVDTLDFSPTTTRAVSINLGNPAAQVVNAGLTLTLSSGATIENVIGGALGDTLTGNALNNVIEGGGGNDVLTGSAGNDIYRFDTDNALGSDTINESGGGVDTLDFSATTTRAVSINLGLAGAQVVNAGLTLTLSSATTMENVIGGALGDTITGNALNNSLSGGAGNDTLDGGAGTDTLDGGAGTDVALNGEVLINIP
jgi:Ca2+-binding RTX toxin-like protein